MQITADQVKQLREMTGVGMMECKKALAEAGGDVEKAIDVLRKSGIAKAEKRSDRGASEGLVESYIHPGNRVGVLIEVNCETDFVARTPEFGALVRDLAMQIAAAGAEYVRREEVPVDRVTRERDIFTGQLEGQNKPANILEKIVEGKVRAWVEENVLNHQKFVKDETKTIEQLLAGAGLKLKRFVRYRVGEVTN
jgi:elongation factor Ts